MRRRLMEGIKMTKVLLFLIFASLPFRISGHWHTLLPNGPINATPQIRMYKPVAPSPPAGPQQQIVQPHTAPLQPSRQEYELQTKSPAAAQEMQSVASAVSSHPTSNVDQVQSAPPQYGYPAAGPFPQPVPAQQVLTQNVAFAMPEWLMQLARSAAGLSAAISSLGLSGMPDINVCGNAPLIKETMICVQNALEEVKSVFLTGKEIVTLNGRVMSGGRTADTALQRLKTISSKPYAKMLMKILGTTMMAQMLMQRESTPDRQRWQAGSVITLVTDIPVATVIADSQTGSFGHVNVVLPRPSRVRRADKMIKMLDEGVDPVNLPIGPLSDLEGRDDIELDPTL